MEAFYKKILVPLDFSQACEMAFMYAWKLASDYGALLLLLTVIDDRFPYPDLFSFDRPNEDYYRYLRERAKRHLDELIHTHSPAATRYEELILRGDPSREILEVAEKENVDLIVMATHGSTGLTHYLLGSVTEKVVRSAPCPVFVVRKKKKK